MVDDNFASGNILSPGATGSLNVLVVTGSGRFYLHTNIYVFSTMYGKKILFKDINIYYQDVENNSCPTYKTRKIYPIVGDNGSPSMVASLANSVTRKGFFC